MSENTKATEITQEQTQDQATTMDVAANPLPQSRKAPRTLQISCKAL
jgi:hypothetical protein